MALFKEEMNKSVFNLISQVEVEFSNAVTCNFSSLDPENRLKLVGLSALMALHHNLFQIQDKKFLIKYWDVCKKVFTIL